MSPDPLDQGLAALVFIAWAWLTLRALRRPRAAPAGGGDRLIGYASQSGYAEALARAQAAQMPGSLVLPLDRIGLTELKTARQALFYISTTGDGDPPDNAAGFRRRIMCESPSLSHLAYGFLALGDRNYPEFCGFGRSVETWLRSCGAKAMMPVIQLDREHPEALQRWQSGLRDKAGLTAAAEQPFSRWRLAARRHLNPGSPGAPLWHLILEPQEGSPAWQAGDIAEIAIPAQPGAAALMREYSLASLPQSGRAELILREVIRTDGTPGQGSHWLSRGLEPGGTVAMRIRSNPGFHPPEDRAPLLLIGNGSGIAGLLAHLRHRAARAGAGPDAAPVWLIHGERSGAHDAIFHDELQGALASGRLARLDRVFSRDGRDLRYVQHVIRASAEAIRDKVARGAVICLCGRREGMAGDVAKALEAVLGPATLADLRAEGRLRQDVY